MSQRFRGFTLLELLVVMVIIGLLAGIVGPKLFKNISKSEVTTARSQIDSFGKAVDTFKIDTGRFPTTEEGLNALVTRPSNSQGWNGAYLKKIPLDPWHMPYQYKFPGTHGDEYDIYSFGSDKASGGEGDAADIGNW